MHTLKTLFFYFVLILSLILTNSESSVPESQEEQNRNASIVIIGAGPSGIAAATKLLRNNFTNVKILEAEGRIGGRVNSVKFGEQYVDLGAQYCHGEEDNIVYYMVQNLKVLQHSEDAVELLLSNGEHVSEDVKKKLFKFEHSNDASENDEDTEKTCQNLTSIGDCFDIRYDSMLKETTNEKEKKILQDSRLWLNSYLCTYDANFDLHDLARKSNYKKCKGDLLLNWNGHGYKTVLEVMMGKFPNPESALPIDDKILLNKEVVSVKNWKEGDLVEVLTKDGETFIADHVIFTPSVGVLKVDHEKLFDPPLPQDKANAIKGIGFGAILKIVLKFPEPLNITNILGTIWTKEDLEEAQQKGFGWLQHITGIVKAENNPKVLIGWYAGGNVTDIEKLTVDQILEGQKYLIEKFLKAKFGVPEPEEFIRSSWYSNPHFRGSYSYESVEGQAKCRDNFQETLGMSLLNKEGKPTLLFAGEATHPYYFSTVHGAIETGYDKAKKLINYYKTMV